MSDLSMALLQTIHRADRPSSEGGFNKARLGGDQDRAVGVWQVFEEMFPQFGSTSWDERFEALWSLLRRGMVSMEMINTPSRWKLHLTDLGLEVIRNPDIAPEDNGPYRAELMRSIPPTSETVLRYSMEAHRVYDVGAYLASAVMMGVASEVAVDELIDTFMDWYDIEQPKNDLRTKMEKAHWIKDRFDLFLNHLQPRRPLLPKQIRDVLDIQFVPIAQAIRITRNDAGHATEGRINRDAARALMIVLPLYLNFLYELRDWLEAEARSAVGKTQ